VKEQIVALLKEAKIEDSVAEDISEGLLAAVKANTKMIEEARAKEEAEAISVVKAKVGGLTKQLEAAKKELSESKETFKKRFEEARQGVKKLIEEDYKSHKAELAQKTKLFVESKWKEVEGVVKEEMLKEAKEDVTSKRIAQISETISKVVTSEVAPQQVAKPDTKELVSLKEGIEALKAVNKKLLDENTELKKKVSGLEVEVKKPLKEIVAESKIGKVTKVNETQDKPNSQFLNEIVRLANYGSKI
jgi:hypothetical protein